MRTSSYIAHTKSIALSVLNSYGMLFFSRSSWFSLLIFGVTFFIPSCGFAALICVVLAVITARLLGFDKTQIATGIYTYSAILFGLGFAANFAAGAAFYLMLILGAVLSMLFSVALSSKLYERNIPGLSLAFIFTTWLVILASRQFAGIGLNEKHIYWMNEAYADGGAGFLQIINYIENWKIPPYVSGYFRSMSAILFQGNIGAGLLLAIGLLLHSRISFSLSVLGYAIALIFNYWMGGFNTGNLSYYNMGTNFMLVSIALGGFYLIPSIRSFLWTFITVPIAYIIVVATGSIMWVYGLPPFSLPFCIVVILFLYCLRIRKNPGRLVITPVQYYRPEHNLYQYNNSKERLMHRMYLPLSLPVMGEWMISQGYNGSITHKGDWSKALDFVILDEEMKTFRLPATDPTHFYAYNKPVLAPADGYVEEIINYVEDNAVGKNNTTQNWGNSIIIRHATGLFSKLSHLKKESIKFHKGDYVRKGDIIGLCGNSGRSPEPHLHWQLQTTPYIGAKTIPYPIAYYLERNENQTTLKSFVTPLEGSFVSNVNINQTICRAFSFLPGITIEAADEKGNKEEWEVFTDALNEHYLYCRATESFAYFMNNGVMFMFTNFIGNKESMLYKFYISCYKIFLSIEPGIKIPDQFALHQFKKGPIRWVQDLLSPFTIFLQSNYTSYANQSSGIGETDIQLKSIHYEQVMQRKKDISTSDITIGLDNSITFTFTKNEIKTTIRCCVVV